MAYIQMSKTALRSPPVPAYALLDRYKARASNPATVGDLLYLPQDILTRDQQAGLVFSPYCLGGENKTTILEVGTSAGMRLDEMPFFYLDQFHKATALRFVPFETAIDLSRDSRKLERPIFVFSIGRAGSTLVSKLLNLAQVTSLSEPDVLLDLGAAKKTGVCKIGSLEWHAIYQYCLAKLSESVGHPTRLAIKFRAQSSNLAHVNALYDLYPNALYVFLFRDPANWARSCEKSFGFHEDTMKWLLTQNLKSAAALLEKGANLQTWRFEDIVEDPHAFLAKTTGERSSPRQSRQIDDLMGKDSQDGMFGRGTAAHAGSGGTPRTDAFLAW